LTELNCACKFKVFSPRTGDRLLILTKTIPSRRLAAVLLGVLLGAATFGFSEVPQRQERPPAEESRRPVSVDTRMQLFATVCALDAAGFESTVNPAGQSPGRAQLRQRMLALQGPAVQALRTFYQEHALADPAATLSRFISFALTAGPPPKFVFEVRRDELPPEALALEGFNEILANFYREAQLDELWKAYQPDYARGVEIYRGPVSELIFTATTYLREIVKSNSPRTFTVYVEPLVGGKTNFRNFGDQYALVVSPSAELPLDDIRHAFLHYLLDPMAIRYRTNAERLQPLQNYAAKAPLFPAEYRDDFSAFFAECLVRAVELRLRRLAPGTLAAAMDQAEGQGYVLVRPIYAGLSGFEKALPAMSYYLPDLIRGIDVGAEARRLRGAKFLDAASTEDAASAAEAVPAVAPKGAAPPDASEQDLAEGQRQIAARNGAAAAASFERILASHPSDLRATYGLAVASALLGQPDRARELFSRVIAASQGSAAEASAQPDAASLSWSHIYLGRMYDVEEKRDLAIAEYQAALAVSGVPESARNAAKRGVDTGYQTPPREPKPDGKP
jgi:tetratricopeptide (TPR) repeat protein